VQEKEMVKKVKSGFSGRRWNEIPPVKVSTIFHNYLITKQVIKIQMLPIE